MKEAFLHYVWETQSFTTFKLLDSKGIRIQIIDPGRANSDSGPDFLQAKIRIQNTILVGHVEIHIRASDWFRHSHHLDQNYDTTILHVCYDVDVQIKRTDGTEIPHLEIKNIIPKQLIMKYHKLQSSLANLPCEKSLPEFDKISNNFKEDLLNEKWQDKFLNWKQEGVNDWYSGLYRLMSRAMGAEVNKEAFYIMAHKVDYKILNKNRDNRMVLETILFGVSGLISSKMNDDYCKSIISKFPFYAHQYQLMPMKKNYWNYSRMRPSNFPDIRIAQFASLIALIPQLDGYY